MTRRLTRVGLRLEVEYRSTGNFLVSFSTNLSQGGLFLQSVDLVPEGTTLRLMLHVPGEAKPIETDARVGWVRAEGSAELPTGMGLAFQALEESYGDVIDRIVQSFEGLRMVLVGHTKGGSALLLGYLHTICTCEITQVQTPAEIDPKIQSPDLVVWVVQDGESIEITVQKIATRALVPVIVLAESEAERAQAREAGAEAALALPPSFPELQAAVISALARPSRVR